MIRVFTHLNESGSAVALAAIFAAVLAILIFSAVTFEKIHTNQTNYIRQMDRTMELADSALSSVMGLISKDPHAYDVDVSLGGLNNAWTDVPLEQGSYMTTVGTRNIPYQGVYYIVITSSRTVSGKPYVIKLHTYARISNVADYFAAINGDVAIGHPTDISSGKIYGLTLTFTRSATYTEGGKTVTGSGLGGATVVKEANFLSEAWPDVDCSVPPCRWTNTPGVLPDVQITNGGVNETPTKLTSPLLLPQILDADMQNFKSLAGPHVDTQLNFTGNIFPPGYNNTTAAAPDPYPVANHTANNADHIYYITSAGNPDVSVQGTVYGQVLIVAEGNIHITGNIQSVDLGAGPAMNPQVGTGISSSTAHQLVLIPGPNHNVMIDKTVCDGTPAQTVTIQALVLSPNGTIDPGPMINTPTLCLSTNTALNFTGSMILGTQPAFRTYFNPPAGNVYSYMNSLATDPPPYLPAITEIEDSFSQIVGSPGMYN